MYTPAHRESSWQHPDWLRVAKAELARDVREIKGDEHTARILMYHAETSLGATADEVPWCSSFVCWVIEQGGLTSTRSAAALSWLRWGSELSQPRPGCIVVFDRRDKNGVVMPNRGHVGFWMAEANGSVMVLGGNQSDSVCLKGYPSEQVVSYRWPKTMTNSTTNIAAVGAGVGGATMAAGEVLQVWNTYKVNKPEVVGIIDEAKNIFGTLWDQPNGPSLLFGGAVTFLCIVHIMRERRKKIRQWGI